MSSPRADFTATLLLNGHVLLAGGQASATATTATADIFDPVTMSITPAAPMKAARSGHTATLLPDGRVLVVGGTAIPFGTVATAEIYDPAADTWSAVAPMQHDRVHQAAVLLADGRVLVVGGSSTPVNDEAYDPGHNSWVEVSVAALTRPFGPTATRLNDGVVMILGGGNNADRNVNALIERYEPATGQVSFDPNFRTQGRNYATATLLGNGMLLIAGGELFTNPGFGVTYSDSYDTTCQPPSCPWPWNAAPSTNVGHCHHTATLLKNGLLLVAGGRCGGADSIDVCELYDPVARKWWPAGPLQDARGYHAAALLPDGRVIVAGGFYPGGTIGSNVEIYTVS